MYDVLIVGSGPAGLSAAVYAKRFDLKVAVLEKDYMGIGQIAESRRVDNYPGFYGISGFDLGEKLREHALALQVEFLAGKVNQIQIADEKNNTERRFSLQCDGGKEYEARSILYAAGASPKKGQIAGEDALVGRGVSYCALCDGAFYKGKKVAVLGGGDTALDDALYLSELCETVYLIHRRETFRGSESTVLQLKEKDNVVFLLKEEADSILGEKRVEGIRLKSGRELAVDGVFVAFGSSPNSAVLGDFVQTDSLGYVVAGEDGKTTCEGIYVAGDIRTKELRQVVTAVSDGANAATSVYKYLHSRS